MQYQITVFNKLPHQFSFQSWELVPHSFYTFHAFCLSSFMKTSFSLILAHFIYHLLKSKYLHIHSFKLDGLNFFFFSKLICDLLIHCTTQIHLFRQLGNYFLLFLYVLIIKNIFTKLPFQPCTPHAISTMPLLFLS